MQGTFVIPNIVIFLMLAIAKSKNWSLQFLLDSFTHSVVGDVSSGMSVALTSYFGEETRWESSGYKAKIYCPFLLLKFGRKYIVVPISCRLLLTFCGLVTTLIGIIHFKASLWWDLAWGRNTEGMTGLYSQDNCSILIVTFRILSFGNDAATLRFLLTLSSLLKSLVSKPVHAKYMDVRNT